LDYLAFEKRAEELVVDRLLTTGLVSVKERRRLIGRTKEVVPRDWTTAGWPMARIRTRLAADTGQLDPPDLVLAALLLALGVFSLERTRLRSAEQTRLELQLRSQLPPMIRDLCRHVQLAYKNTAINR